MAPPRPPRDPNKPKAQARPRKTGAPKAKSPSASARDARRAEQHAEDTGRTGPARRAPTRPDSAEPGRTPRGRTPSENRPPRDRADRAAPRAGTMRKEGSSAERTARPTRDRPASERPTRAPDDRSTRFSRERPERPFADRAPPRAGTIRKETSGAERIARPTRDRPASERPTRAPDDRSTRFSRERPERPFADRAPRGRPDSDAPQRAPTARRGAARHEPRAPAPAPMSATPVAPGQGERIAKLLARAGIASRREIERFIAEGRIAIGGTIVETPATILKSLNGVTFDGRPVEAPEATRLFRFYKPTGFLTAERDPKGRPTIYDRLPAGLPRLMPVGRLDMNTEGLLLMTTDGGLKRQLELPATGVERVYRARVFGEVSQASLESLIDGIEIEGVRYGSIDANMERRTGRNGWVEMRLKEGKNREVRRVLEYLGLQVSRLIRTRYGPFMLGDMPPGSVDEIRQHELVAFRKTLK